MPDHAELSAAVADQMPRVREDLAALVAFPSVHVNHTTPPACARAAEWVAESFGAEGFADVELSDTDDGSKVVHGSIPGPEGAPSVLLYSHYDVQPADPDSGWHSSPWQLTERDGRWYGRGAADCKGNVVMHLAALRALRAAGGELPCTVKLVCEGSEEQGTGGLERWVVPNASRLAADTILIADGGNAEAGLPTMTTTLRGMAQVDVTLSGLESPMHSGSYGGAAPDALLGLIHLLDSLTDDDAGDVTIDGLDASGRWEGEGYDADRFRVDATVLDGAELIGSGDVADQVWARPAVTITGIDSPRTEGAVNAVPATARARVSLRVPPGVSQEEARGLLVEHLERRVPWGLRFATETIAGGEPFATRSDGPAFTAMSDALSTAFGRPAIVQGQGGSIPLCSALAEVYPDAEILNYGVEEPQCLIHAANESVDPSEIEKTALAEAIFLAGYGR